MLPTRPYDLGGFRTVDASARFKGKRFMACDLPLDNLNAVGELRDGVLVLKPLDLGIAGGLVSSTLTLDAREKQIRTTVEATVRGIELKEILPAVKPPNGSAGKVSGRARFSATGNSIADMLASSNGEVAALSWGARRGSSPWCSPISLLRARLRCCCEAMRIRRSAACWRIS